MSNSPFFSVIIPTKNRSHIIGFAIKSVLEQSFGDFEIIVSDNDDSDTLTRDAVASFNDPRIKYYRTGGLSMPDNWEFGLSKSTGRYITVLEDKQAFYPDALQIIYKVALGCNAEVIMWGMDFINDISKIPLFIKRIRTGIVSRYSSDEILKGFLEDKDNTFRGLPVLINSCVHRSLVEFVSEKTPLKRFFIPVNPDYCAAFIQLNYVDEIIYIDSSLCIWGAMSESSGTMLRKNPEDHKKYFNLPGTDEDVFCSHVPIKSRHIMYNTVLNDYLRLREVLGGRIENYTMSNRNYIILCFRDIVKYRSDPKKEIGLWREYLRAQDPSVRKGLWWVFIKIIVKNYLGKFAGTYPILYKINYRLPWIKAIKARVFTGFNNILDLVRDKRFSPRVFMDKNDEK